MTIQKTIDHLEGIRSRYKIYAVTREAYVGQIAHATEGLFDHSKLWSGLLATRAGGPEIDIESCRALLDEEFANRAINLAIKLINETAGAKKI